MPARLLLAIIAALVCTLAAAQEEVRLPDIGSSAGEILSPEQARQVGSQLYYELRGQNALLDDPQIEEFVGSLGYRLVAHSERPEQEFEFFVVRSPEINAFAAPGGFVGVNAGLIATAETESELAAVLAHEVAHVTQNHLVRAYEKLTKVSLPIALAMLGAIIAASRGSGGGDAAQAAVVGGSALLQQSAINFTRGNEYEADRIGITTLARSGYEPAAMATMFGRMSLALRANGEGPPEFLRTHPVTTTRISEAKDRAEQIAHGSLRADDFAFDPTKRPLVSTLPAIRFDPPPAPVADPDRPGTAVAATVADPAAAPASPPTAIGPSPRGSAALTDAGTARAATVGARALPPTEVTAETSTTTAFLLFRERARVLGHDDARPLIDYYRELLEVSPRAVHLRYGHALALLRSRRIEEAREIFRDLAAADPQRSTYVLALAEAEQRSGRPRDAEQRLARLMNQVPGNRAVTLAYAEQLLFDGTRASAVRAIDVLRPLLARPGGGGDAPLQVLYARACETAGDEIRAGEAHAEVALLNGRFDDALGQLDRLLKRADIDYYQRARIQARIAEITPIALEQRRRGHRDDAANREDA